MPRTHRLSTRIVLLVMALLAVAVLGIGVAARQAVQYAFTESLDNQLLGTQERMRDHDQMMGPPRRGDPLAGTGIRLGTLAVLVDAGEVASAQVLREDGRVALTGADIATLTAVPPDAQPTTVRLGLGSYRVVSIALVDAAGGSHLLVTGLPMSELDESMRTMTRTVALVAVAALLALGLLGTWLIRRSLRPLEHVSAVALELSTTQLARGEVALTRRVPPEASDPSTEVGAVGAAMNLMLDNVEDGLQARQHSETTMRQFVADASHELRTPLSAIKGYAEMLRLSEPLTPSGATALDRVESQAARMSTLVENLLLLARLDEGLPPAFGDVDLGEVVLEAVGDARAAWPRDVWRIQVPREPLTVRGDGSQLGAVVANVFSNAAKHTPEGTVVMARVGRDGSHAVVVVEDDGPGMPPEVAGRAFDRFVRGDEARTGDQGSTGLGLAIVSAIVTAHGGDASLESRPGRTTVTLRLPLAPGELQAATPSVVASDLAGHVVKHTR